MIRNIVFYFLLTAVVLVCFWRGRQDERFAAMVCVLGTIATNLVVDRMPIRFQSFNLLSFFVDLAVFALFLELALRSKRFWPLWVAALQLATILVHLLKVVQPDLMRFVFGAALAFWSYPILLIVALGALRTPLVERWRREGELPASR